METKVGTLFFVNHFIFLCAALFLLSELKAGSNFCAIKYLTFSGNGCFYVFGHFMVTSVGFADKIR
jgi:hypothetical protein